MPTNNQRRYVARPDGSFFEHNGNLAARDAVPGRRRNPPQVVALTSDADGNTFAPAPGGPSAQGTHAGGTGAGPRTNMNLPEPLAGGPLVIDLSQTDHDSFPQRPIGGYTREQMARVDAFLNSGWLTSPQPGRPPTVDNPLGLNLPNLYYDSNGYYSPGPHLQPGLNVMPANAGCRGRSQKLEYDKPPAPEDGFTRDTNDTAEFHFWAIKECGHVSLFVCLISVFPLRNFSPGLSSPGARSP